MRSFLLVPIEWVVGTTRVLQESATSHVRTRRIVVHLLVDDQVEVVAEVAFVIAGVLSRSQPLVHRGGTKGFPCGVDLIVSGRGR